VGGFTQFGTGAIFPANLDGLVRRVGVSRVWRADTASDPSGRFWCDSTGELRSVWFVPRVGVEDPEARPARQLVISARDDATVGQVLSLVHAGCLMAYPSWTQIEEVGFFYPLGTIEPEGLAVGAAGDEFREYSNIDVGLRAAAAAWPDSGGQYALLKYRLSLGLDSITPHSAHPRHGDLFGNRYDNPRQHVGAGYAILAAHNVIEELGLDIRSSKENPRFLQGDKGGWNPKVFNHVCRRLRHHGIDPATEVEWLQRGSVTKVERAIKPKLGHRSKWSRRYLVRDRTMTIVEAIHYVSYVRNYVVAHKFHPLTTAISPYDVYNAQSVARRLLLGYLGLWDYVRSRAV